MTNIVELIDTLLDESKDGAISAQVLLPGAAIPGAIRKAKYPGVYEILTKMAGGSGRCFVVGEHIQGIMVPNDQPSQTSIFMGHA